jgi:hypothetical protein
MDSERMPIDFFEKKELLIGSIIGIYGTYYPISYWNVHNLDEDILTLIKLDKNYMPLLIEPEMIQIEKSLINFFIVSNFNNLVIPYNYFQSYYQNRIIQKKPRYGDLILLKNNINDYDLFRILNFDPITGSHLCVEANYSNQQNYYSRNHSILLNLSIFSVVSTKELRRDIIEKSKQLKLSLSKSNYERLKFLDDYLLFKDIMNYLEEKSHQNEIRLNELVFLNGENNEAQPLQDLIKFDNLQLEDEYCPDNVSETTFTTYEPINHIIINCEKNESPLIKYLMNDDPLDFQNCKVYDYWQTDSICDNYVLDEIISYNNDYNMCVTYTYQESITYDSIFLKNENYIYNDDLIKLYDTDEEVDLRNMDTFYMCEDNEKIDIYNDHILLDNSTNSEIIEGKSFSTSYDTDNEKCVERLDVQETETISLKNDNECILELNNDIKLNVEIEKNMEELLQLSEIDEYITLEKEDFEPFVAERSCSVM